MLRKAARGEPEQWVLRALEYEGDECLVWPFSTAGQGKYGQLWVDGVRTYSHSEVCRRAHGERPTEKHEAAHSCNNRLCGTKRHLSWKTHAQNVADREHHGTNTKGEKNGMAKLTSEDVLAIRASSDTCENTALRFGTTSGNVSAIRLRKTWKHV